MPDRVWAIDVLERAEVQTLICRVCDHESESLDDYHRHVVTHFAFIKVKCVY